MTLNPFTYRRRRLNKINSYLRQGIDLTQHEARKRAELDARQTRGQLTAVQREVRNNYLPRSFADDLYRILAQSGAPDEPAAITALREVLTGYVGEVPGYSSNNRLLKAVTSIAEGRYRPNARNRNRYAQNANRAADGIENANRPNNDGRQL